MLRMIAITAALVGLLFMSSPSFATQGGEGNNTGCNGQGNPNSPCQGNGGAGGAGGPGGAGGTGIGVGIGGGANVKNTNTNTNVNANTNRQGQRQNQGQVQGQQQGQGQGQQQGYQGYSGAEVRIDGGPRQAPSVAVSGDVSNITCFGHIGGGATTPFGGLNVIAPKMDMGCHRVRMHNVLERRGYTEEALEILLQDDNVAEAFESVRARKAGASVKPAPSAVVETQAASTNFGQTQGN